MIYFLFLEEGHLASELLTNLYELRFRALTFHGVEVRAAYAVLQNPVTANVPSWISVRTFFISLRVSSVMMRLPVT